MSISSLTKLYCGLFTTLSNYGRFGLSSRSPSGLQQKNGSENCHGEFCLFLFFLL